jgi:excisionase family DNA binding protein
LVLPMSTLEAGSMPDLRAFYSVREVAETLSLRQHSILALIACGELRAIDVSLKRGRRPHWRIAGEDLERFIASRTCQTAAPRPRRRKFRTRVKQYF